MSSHLPPCINPALTGLILVNVDVGDIYYNLSRKSKFGKKLDENTGHLI